MSAKLITLPQYIALVTIFFLAGASTGALLTLIATR
jgi:hypothetical protein